MKTDVDLYFESLDAWQPELLRLRKLILGFHLEEVLKWGAPAYLLKNRRVTGIHGFKNHFALWFYNGVFLQDPHKLLISATDNTKALRQIRLSSMEELTRLESVIADYIAEAIEVERAGLKLAAPKESPLEIPEALSRKFISEPLVAQAFENLTPGRRKEYVNYIAEARQASTREARIEKIVPLILQGKGLNDKYKNC